MTIYFLEWFQLEDLSKSILINKAFSEMKDFNTRARITKR